MQKTLMFIKKGNRSGDLSQKESKAGRKIKNFRTTAEVFYFLTHM